MQPPDRHCESLNARNRNARLAAYRLEMQRQPKFGVGRSRLQIHLGRLAKAFLIRQVPRLSAAGMWSEAGRLRIPVRQHLPLIVFRHVQALFLPVPGIRV